MKKRSERALHEELLRLEQRLWFTRTAFLRRTKGVTEVTAEAIAIFEDLKHQGLDDDPTQQEYHRLEGKVAALRWALGAPPNFYDT